MKKEIFIPVSVILSLVFLLVLGLWYMEANTLGLSVGRVLVTDSRVMLIRGNSPIAMSDRTGRGSLFKKLTTGDKVLVLHTGIAESYPGQTGAHAVFKLADGDLSDIGHTVLDELTKLGWYSQTK